MFADEIAFARKDRELFFPSPPLTCSQRKVHGKKTLRKRATVELFKRNPNQQPDVLPLVGRRLRHLSLDNLFSSRLLRLIMNGKRCLININVLRVI